jgi:hypothetical protein
MNTKNFSILNVSFHVVHSSPCKISAYLSSIRFTICHKRCLVNVKITQRKKFTFIAACLLSLDHQLLPRLQPIPSWWHHVCQLQRRLSAGGGGGGMNVGCRVKCPLFRPTLIRIRMCRKFKVVQIWPGQTVTCLHTNRSGHIWTTLYWWGYQI